MDFITKNIGVLIALIVVVAVIVAIIVLLSVRESKYKAYEKKINAEKERKLYNERNGIVEPEEDEQEEVAYQEEAYQEEANQEEAYQEEPVSEQAQNEQPAPAEEVTTQEQKQDKQPAVQPETSVTQEQAKEPVKEQAKEPAKEQTQSTTMSADEFLFGTAAVKTEPAKKPAPVAKEPAKEKAEEKSDDKAKGKWLLVPVEEGYWFAQLIASNGLVILQTERYKGDTGLKSGIDTIRRNLEKDNYEISIDKNNKANFKLYAANHGLLCIGEGYPTKDSALSAFQSVKNFAPSPFEYSTPENAPAVVVQKRYEFDQANQNVNGKWVIYNDQDGYTHAELKANNGQVLLVTEQYKGGASLASGLESLKKNILAGNFGTRKDKNDNYNFKIFSENKRLLAIGAGYTSLDSCENAINSVMKFCNSEVVFAEVKQ